MIIIIDDITNTVVIDKPATRPADTGHNIIDNLLMYNVYHLM